MLGEFFAAVKDQYPHWEALVPPGMPPDLAPHVVHHRFRTAEDHWPLAQLGPGIMTVNDTEGYRWEDFNRGCVALLEVLIGLHAAAGQTFQPVHVSLRYIDAEVLGDRSVTELLAKLKLKLEPHPQLFASGHVIGSLVKSREISLRPIDDNPYLPDRTSRFTRYVRKPLRYCPA
jgi:uncharacterized protein (TIGR04255 family)